MNQEKPLNQQKNPDQPRQLNPKKLLLSKWTAVNIIDKQKHFLVTRLIMAEPPMMTGNLTQPVHDLITHVEIEAVFSSNKQIILWHELKDPSRWKQGWC